jgi:hypothetical protein
MYKRKNYLFLSAIISLMILLSGCSGWTYNGIRGEDLQRPSAKMLAGAGTSFVVHTTGHFVAMLIMGKELHFEGLSEITNDELTDAEAAWFGRAGFLAQVGFGYGMKLAGVKGDFIRGYNAATVFEVVTYPMWQPIRGKGDDLELIERGQGGQAATAEWAFWSGAAIGLNYDKLNFVSQ